MKICSAKQYTPEWWAARCGIPTASKAGCIFTSTGAASKQAYAYMCELIGQMYDPGYGTSYEPSTLAMEIGSALETHARKAYEFERGVDVTEVGFCTSDDGAFGGSPDGLIGSDGGLEIKCGIYKTHVEWLLSGRVPPKHMPQIQMSLIVTGRQWWDFMSYAYGMPSLIVRVERDELTDKCEATLRDFVEQMRATIDKIRALGVPAVYSEPEHGNAEIAEAVDHFFDV